MKNTYSKGPRDFFGGLTFIKPMMNDFFGFCLEQQKKYGDRVSLRVFNERLFLLFHPNDIRALFINHHKSFARWHRTLDVLKYFQGHSVLTTEGELWQRQRRILQPGFSPKRFGEYCQHISHSVEDTLQYITTKYDTPNKLEKVDFLSLSNTLTMDAILRTMFSTQLPQKEARNIEQAVHQAGKISYQEMFYPASLPMWLPTTSNNTKRHAKKILDQLIWDCIHQRKQDSTHYQDLLSMLFEASDEQNQQSAEHKLADQEIHDQCMTIFLAGHETSSCGLAWTVWLLATHPEILQQVTQQIDTVLANRMPTYEDLEKLDFLERIIKESMRLYPPAPALFTRVALEDVTINDLFIPKNSLVHITTFLPHRDPRWFKEPLIFNPDRFLPTHQTDEARNAYMPFGLGPRTCIASRFAITEIMIILSMLLQRFTFLPVENLSPEMSVQITLHPKKLLLNLVKRASHKENAS